jgi:UPF0716 protein FxsA
MPWLILLFVVVPIVELGLLIEIGRRIGTLPTLVLILLTGITGAALAKWQGLAVLGQIRRDLSEGRLPAAAVVDGALVLMAAAVLMTPGLLTDVVGFLCFIPTTRRLIRTALWRRLQRAVGYQRGPSNRYGP